MSDPFASLLLNGVKQIETRNSGVLSAGKGLCLLHIGRKDWPSDAYIEELWRMGIPESSWPSLTKPPSGFKRGQIAGIVELGETRRGTESDFTSDEVRRKVVARRENMGKFMTPVISASWLTRPVPMSGKPGVFHTTVPRAVLPEAIQLRVDDAPDEPWRGLSGAPGPLPRLVVFDLDGCCWHPEMYQTVGGPPYRAEGADGTLLVNTAGEPIRLLRAAQGAWLDIAEGSAWRARGTKLAVASSSYESKARPLLDAFQLRPVAPGKTGGGLSMSNVAGDLVEIYYRKNEGKRLHFQELHRRTGVAYEDMIFFDDSQQNLDSVAQLGVICQLTPEGFTTDAMESALARYRRQQQRQQPRQHAEEAMAGDGVGAGSALAEEPADDQGAEARRGPVRSKLRRR